jgi:hypothetical protein
METYQQRSPISFASRKAKTEQRGGWEVVIRYEDEGRGPFLGDLSCQPKWDIQDANLSAIQPLGISIPEIPGKCLLKNGLLLNRMNKTQAGAWRLFGDQPDMPQEVAYTDVTEAYALLSLIGKEMFFIMERITQLDLSSPKNTPPFLIQGPVLDIPCQIVILGETEGYHGILIAYPRGYGQSVADAILDAGAEWGLRPAGEDVFRNWAGQLEGV